MTKQKTKAVASKLSQESIDTLSIKDGLIYYVDGKETTSERFWERYKDVLSAPGGKNK